MTSASETEAPPQSFCFGFYSAAHVKEGAGIWLDIEGREQTVTHVFDEMNPEDLAGIPGIQRRGVLVRFLRPIDSEYAARLAIVDSLMASMKRRTPGYGFLDHKAPAWWSSPWRTRRPLYSDSFLIKYANMFVIPETLDPPTIVIDDIGKRRYDLTYRVEKPKE